MSKSESRDCPLCKNEITTWPAISRIDNETDICSDCGLTESLEQWKQYKQEGNSNE